MRVHRRRRTDHARILVVEDNELLRAFMETALCQEGYQVDTADSAEIGVSLMERGRYQLVLTDYRLPFHTGVWLLRQAVERDLLHGAATLLVTADTDAPDIAPGQDVVPKPVDLAHFLPLIRGILAQGLDAGGAAAPGSPVQERAEVELVLYVSSASVSSIRAQRILRDILDKYEPHQVKLSITDVGREPEDAARDRVLFTPTLVKRTPPPTVWILGDLSQTQVVLDLLHMCGLDPNVQSGAR